MNQPHKYEGKLIACLKCFKKPSDPIHLMQQQTPLLFTPQNKPAPMCSGHSCPMCNDTWKHGYDCGAIDTHGLCEKCAQQTAADIARPVDIDRLSKSAEWAKEDAELCLQHEEFVVVNILQKHGDKWLEPLMSHMERLEKVIHEYQIYITATKRVKRNQEVQDLNKVSPEDREEYLKNRSKALEQQKPKKSSTVAPITGTKKEKAIKSMLKLLGKADDDAGRAWLRDNGLLSEDE